MYFYRFKKGLTLFSLLVFLCVSALASPPRSPAPVFVVSPQDFSKVNRCKKPVLLDVHASWCPLSQKMKSVFDEAAHKFKSIRFAKILIDNFEDTDATIAFIKKTYKVSIGWAPTLLFIKDGKVVATLQEGMDLKTLTNKLNQLLKSC